MGYNTSAEKVRANRELLDLMALAVEEGKPLPIDVPPAYQERAGNFRWRLREILKSAEEYPEKPEDAELAGALAVESMSGDKVRVMPKPEAQLRFAGSASSVLNDFKDAITQVFRDNQGSVRWAEGLTKFDPEEERQRFREGLEGLFHLEHTGTEEVAGHTVHSWQFHKREADSSSQRPTKEEYYEDHSRPRPFDLLNRED